MKHIKQYESIELNDLKKFVIYQSTSRSNDNNIDHYLLYIFEILTTNNTEVFVKRHYEYNTILEKLIPNEKAKIRGTLNFLLENTQFTSDDIQDCIDILPVLTETKKYNL